MAAFEVPPAVVTVTPYGPGGEVEMIDDPSVNTIAVSDHELTIRVDHGPKATAELPWLVPKPVPVMVICIDSTLPVVPLVGVIDAMWGAGRVNPPLTVWIIIPPAPIAQATSELAADTS
jgi:hypothetical protein